MSDPVLDKVDEMAHLSPEQKAEFKANILASRERNAELKSTSTEDEAMRQQESYLKGVGFGRRYWYPVIARIPDDIRFAIQDYVHADSISKHIREGMGMMIGGEVGAGKTHALSYIALQCHDHWVQYVFAPDLFAALMGKTDEAREKVMRWERCDLLLLDDVDRLYGHDYPVMAFDSFVEHRHTDCRATVVTLNSAEMLQKDARLGAVKDRWADTMVQVETQAQSQRGK